MGGWLTGRGEHGWVAEWLTGWGEQGCVRWIGEAG